MKKQLAAAFVAFGALAGTACTPNPQFQNPRNYEVATLNDNIGPNYKVTPSDDCAVLQAHDQTAVLTDAASLNYIVEVGFGDVHTQSVVDIGDGFFEVGIDLEKLEASGVSMEDRILAARGAGETAMLNLLYFFQPQGVFYPVDQAKASPDRNGHTPTINTAAGGAVSQPVITIDTGHINGNNASRLAYRSVAGLGQNYTIDAAQPDDVTGHGPAIADLIGRLIVDADRSQLVNVHPVGVADMGNGPIRTFTASALRQTLNQVSSVIGDQPVTINMSFGAKACDRFFRNGDAIDDVVYDWIEDHPQVTVVAAAGNSGTNTRTYPAAWSDDPTVGTRVIAVGATGPGGNRSCYSDWGTWVDVYVEGDEVWINHPTMGDVVWSGTSFATPQVAAAVAEFGVQNLMAANGAVPSANDPTANEKDQCVNL